MAVKLVSFFSLSLRKNSNSSYSFLVSWQAVRSNTQWMNNPAFLDAHRNHWRRHCGGKNFGGKETERHLSMGLYRSGWISLTGECEEDEQWYRSDRCGSFVLAAKSSWKGRTVFFAQAKLCHDMFCLEKNLSTNFTHQFSGVGYSTTIACRGCLSDHVDTVQGDAAPTIAATATWAFHASGVVRLSTWNTRTTDPSNRWTLPYDHRLRRTIARADHPSNTSHYRSIVQWLQVALEIRNNCCFKVHPVWFFDFRDLSRMTIGALNCIVLPRLFAIPASIEFRLLNHGRSIEEMKVVTSKLNCSNHQGMKSKSFKAAPRCMGDIRHVRAFSSGWSFEQNQVKIFSFEKNHFD